MVGVTVIPDAGELGIVTRKGKLGIPTVNKPEFNSKVTE